MKTVYVVEKRVYVHGDEIEPGAVTSWVLDCVYKSKPKAEKYAKRFNDNPNSLKQRCVKKYVND